MTSRAFSRLASGPAAGRARDEVLRSLGEQLDLRPLQRAQPRREGRIGEPLAQQRNRALVLGTGETRCRNFQAGIAEEPMNDLAARLAHLEKVEQGAVAVRAGRLARLTRRSVDPTQVAGQ